MPVEGQNVMPEGKRKLAAILSADVAGYSRLMGTDESLIRPFHSSTNQLTGML